MFVPARVASHIGQKILRSKMEKDHCKMKGLPFVETHVIQSSGQLTRKDAWLGEQEEPILTRASNGKKSRKDGRRASTVDLGRVKGSF